MRILTINSGSSSIKFSLHTMARGETVMLSGTVAGIGTAAGRFRVVAPDGTVRTEEEQRFKDHAEALRAIMIRLEGRAEDAFDAVGHRLVHGGSAYIKPHRINAELISALDALIPFAPDHLPHEIAAVRELGRLFPGVPQVACFDTAFHRTMPEVAQRYALPEEVRQQGVLRYGFHGLSYEYILSKLAEEEGPHAAQGRVIVAHLGNGASMAAFKGAKSMDTTMGFTPAGGLVMSTRSGDLDPGVMVYLLREKGMDAASLNRTVNKQAGLLGVSGTSPDMRELLVSVSRGDSRAGLAVQLFCYQAKKFLGALAAVLGGIDTLVFTGGIGEHAPAVREGICDGLEFLGIRLDAAGNKANQAVISSDGAAVQVRVMRTNEEVMIARHTCGVISASDQQGETRFEKTVSQEDTKTRRSS